MKSHPNLFLSVWLTINPNLIRGSGNCLEQKRPGLKIITPVNDEQHQLFTLGDMRTLVQEAGPWFNIKMSSYRHRKSHCGDKMILRPSYLHNGISYTDKMISLYWIRALVSQAGISNCIPQNTVGYNYLSLPKIPVSGTKVLNISVHSYRMHASLKLSHISIIASPITGNFTVCSTAYSSLWH